MLGIKFTGGVMHCLKKKERKRITLPVAYFEGVET
jgi:hypothetical protein